MATPVQEGIAVQLTLFNTTSHGRIHSHLVGDPHAAVRASGIDKEKDLAAPLMPLLLC